MKQNSEINQGVKIGMIVLFIIDIILMGIYIILTLQVDDYYGFLYSDVVMNICSCLLALGLLLFTDHKKCRNIAYCVSMSQVIFFYGITEIATGNILHNLSLSEDEGNVLRLFCYVCFFILVACSFIYPIYVHTSISKRKVLGLTVFLAFIRVWIMFHVMEESITYALSSHCPIEQTVATMFYVIAFVLCGAVIPIMFLLLWEDGVENDPMETLQSFDFGHQKEETCPNTSPKFYFEHRSVALCIFLSFTTFGIYFIYWFVRIVKQVKEFHGDYSSYAGEVWLNLLVPFYGLYWLFTRNRQMYLDAYQRGETMKDSSGTCLVFAILGMPLISYAIMQNNMNRYTEIQKIKIQNVPKPQIPVPSHVNITREAHINNNAEPVKKETNIKDKLKELQDMLSSGLITQEDYDNKKQEILKQM